MIACNLNNTVITILKYLFTNIIRIIYMILLMSVDPRINLCLYLHNFYNSSKHCE